ncbi:universal stress protein [Arenibacter sp. TNZ]|uniref:universal stress protein n=1 Tax=Arenibacter TaxID=178469 RepID=UPI000CD40F38|nr:MULTISPECIES: universal stress protein [Arenibacter]MCM4172366.1 universal stress protein [Arenibacter sp. TNZ]
MKQILVPTDFSENAWNALLYGLDLFQNTKCIFYLLHVNPVTGYSGASSTIQKTSLTLKENLLNTSMGEMRIWMERIEKLPVNTKHMFFPLIHFNYFIDTIKSEVQHKNIDLIIMGTKGATGLKKATIGSNTGDVITKVKCPLLAVPEDVEYIRPKEIVFPTDYQIGYDLKVLDSLIEMTNMNKAVLRILHISKKGEELNQEQLKNKDFLQDYLLDVDHSFHSLTGTKLETAVQCFTESRDIDMISMVAKNLNFFQKILFRPAVEEISYHTKVPFLVLHE